MGVRALQTSEISTIKADARDEETHRLGWSSLTAACAGAADPN